MGSGPTLLEQKEKKVEYLELIYDLIFVYMVGRNNSLLHHFSNGFVDPNAFASYVLVTLAIIQIWNFTTFYINMFGRNGVRDHIFLFVNMYLLYFIGQSTRADWHAYQTQYHIAWGLILVNIGLQYVIELRNHKMDLWNREFIKRMAAVLFTESVFVFLAAIPNPTTGLILSVIAVLTGIFMTSINRKTSAGGQVDFAHLTERAMLYVVFTFGEMIIAVSGYFIGDGSWDWNVIYYSLMGFLVVVGLFLIYGVIYDNVIDREGDYDGMPYMALHIFIIFFMNNITASLEFMREEEILLMPKMLLLIGSLVGYYVFLFSLKGHIKPCYGKNRTAILIAAGVTVLFAVLMILFRERAAVHILLTVLYVFSMFAMLYRFVLTHREMEVECAKK